MNFLFRAMFMKKLSKNKIKRAKKATITYIVIIICFVTNQKTDENNETKN